MKQFVAYPTQEFYDKVFNLSRKKFWSMSQTQIWLMEKAFKEMERKRVKNKRATKKVHS